MIADLIRNKWGFYRDFSVTEVKHVLGILNVNSFVVHDGAEDGMDLIGREAKLKEQCHEIGLYFGVGMRKTLASGYYCTVVFANSNSH